MYLYIKVLKSRTTGCILINTLKSKRMYRIIECNVVSEIKIQ